MKIQVINVKLPFIEAIEHLHNDENAIGCICLDDSRHCVISLTDNNELKIIEEDLFSDCIKEFNELTTRLLSLNNILEHQWNMIYKIID